MMACVSFPDSPSQNGQCEQAMAIMDDMIGTLDLKVPHNAPGATVALNSALKSCSIAGR